MVKNINAQERDKVTKVLRSLNCKVYDSQTNFILFKAPIDNMEVYAKLEEQDVLIGAPIGMNRVSLGNPEMNEKFIKIQKYWIDRSSDHFAGDRPFPYTGYVYFHISGKYASEQYNLCTPCDC